MNERHRGACLCGAVRFSFVGEPKFVADCVCESCRRAHGAAAVTWVGVMTDQFSLDGDSSSLRWYASSADSERGFCADCGTRLFFRSSRWQGETHMAVACIEAPHELRSTLVSFDEELPAWTALRLPAANERSH